MMNLSKRELLTILFLCTVLVEVYFFLSDSLHLFVEKSQKRIAHLIESKKNATMSMAITAVHLIDISRLSNDTLKALSRDLNRHTKFKNIWFKIVDKKGTILWASIAVKNHNPYSNLPWEQGYFSDFVIDCKGIHIASFAPFSTQRVERYFGVISQFNSIQKELEKQGIDSITVVDRKFEKKAFGLVENIGGYKIVNLSPNPRFLQFLRGVEIDELIRSDYLLQNGTIIGKYPLRSLGGEVMGWVFFAKPVQDIIFDLFYKKIFIFVGLFFLFLLAFVYFFLRIAYREQKQLSQYYRKILDRLGEIVFITDTERILYANRKFYDYFHRKVKCICDLLVNEEGFLKKEDWKEFIKKEGESRAKIRVGNQEYVFLLRATKIASNEYSVVMIDITRQYYYEKSLEVKALKDPLTGLYNRYMLIQTFLRIKEESRIEGSDVLLVLFDIDHFKKINDTYGHDKGDMVLRELAKILQSYFRSEDMLFRIGGEEFLLLLKTKDIGKILSILSRLKEEIATYDFNGIHLTISMGVAKWCGEPFEEFFKRADEALYRSKKGGRNKITYEGKCNDT